MSLITHNLWPAMFHAQPSYRTGQFICSKTGQLYLLTTQIQRIAHLNMHSHTIIIINIVNIVYIVHTILIVQIVLTVCTNKRSPSNKHLRVVK